MPKGIHTAYFAGGCFWGIEKKMNELDGIVNTSVGYMGGKIKNPTYEQVSTGKTGYVETVRVSYQKNKLSYKDLLIYFLKIHDPTSLDKQGADKGPQYRSVVFYKNQSQKKTYLKLIQNYTNIQTQLLPQTKFYKAEDYHQKYSFQKKCKSIQTENKQVFHSICKNNQMKAEKKGTGKYLHHSKKGIYQCSCCENPLYHSKDKYDSKTGWPAFSKTISEKNILYNPKNNELRCAQCGLHLGHRTFDGPTSSKIHDCINSACLYFKPRKLTHRKK